MPTRAYRLRVRDASTEANPNGTTDVLLVTSLAAGPQPYVAAAPEGDGQEIDLITGGLRTGTYTIRVLDQQTGSDSTGTIRYITNRLEDAEFRQQLLSRRAYIEVTEDNGANWDVLQAGYVIGVRLASATAYEFTIGDTRRVETQRKAFTWTAQPGPTGISERDVFPQRGCLIGGPIIGGFGPVPDTGGDEFRIAVTPELDPISGRMLVPLTCLAAYLPPAYTRIRSAAGGGAVGNPSAISPWYAKILQPYAQSYTQITGVSDPFIRSLLDVRQEWYPDLDVTITDGTDTWYGFLFAAALLQGGTFLVAALDAAGTASPPAASTTVTYRVRVVKREVGEDAPIYVDQHPVEIVTNLFDTVGIPWDATTAASVRARLGDDLRYALRITQPIGMLEFLTRSVFGPFGFSIRTNADGEQEFYQTRLLNADSPTLTVTTDALTTADPPVFAIDETTIVSGFKITYRTFARTTQQPNASPPPPPDGIVTSTVPVVIQNGDLSVFSTREVEYDFPGFVHLAGAWASAMGELILAIATLGFDRYGRGAPQMEVSILASDPAYAAQLGDEVYLDVTHYPNRGYRIGESTVGPRIAQIVRRTIRPYGADLKLVDSGLDLQPVTPAATISIAGNTGAPRTVADFTITNAAAVNATGVLFVAVQWAIAASTPAGDGAVFARYEPGAVPTGPVSLPPVAPGLRVWVRARTEQTERRPSAWSAWDDVTLDAFDPPTDLTIDTITAESFAVSWTPDDPTYFTDVFIAPGTVAPSDWAPFRVARFAPGSDRTTLRGLTAATDYIVGVAHVDPGTGERTVFDTATDTTAANALVAPTPIAVTVIPSQPDAGQPVGIGLGLWPFDESYDFEIQRAPDASGVPGTWETIGEVGGTTQVYRDLLPSDGAVRWYRVRHTLPGFDPSPWTGAQSGTPGACPVDLNRPDLTPVINAYAVFNNPDYDIFWSGVGTIEYRINGGSWSTPPASPINYTPLTADRVYEFRAELNGITVTTRVEIPGNPALVPVISVAQATTLQSPDCGIIWICEVSWDSSPANDTEYKIEVERTIGGSGILVADGPTGVPDAVNVNGNTGDPLGSGTMQSCAADVRVIRRSDNAVIQTVTTNTDSVDTGPPC